MLGSDAADQVRAVILERVSVVELDPCAESRGLLHLIQRHLTGEVRRVCRDQPLHARCFGLAEHEQRLLRKNVAGGKREVVFRDHGQRLLHFGQQLTVLHYGNEGGVGIRIPAASGFLFRISRRQPYDLARLWIAADRGHVLDTRDVHATV